MPFPTQPYGLETSYYPQHSRYRAGLWHRTKLVLLALAVPLGWAGYYYLGRFLYHLFF